jgi:hypothetical protein
MAKNSLSKIDQQLADDMGRFFFDPLGFVLYAYEWGKGELSGFDGPFDWQRDYLVEWGEALRENNFNGITAVTPIRMARASGHGIGKSALTAWVTDFIMSTRPFCRGTVTANTGTQLETKTWAEIAKWTKRCITSHWFSLNMGRGSMRMFHKAHPEDWFCSAQTCKEENSEAFAGQHAVISTSFYIFDEASAVPDKIHEVAEGGMTDGEPMMFAYGNPTRNTGWFKECFYKQRHRWNIGRIDSRSVPITNKTEIANWIQDYGDDSDFVRVRVKGEFPRSSVKQFIPQDVVDNSRGRIISPMAWMTSPKIIGVDVALQGDDQSVIITRQGPAAYALKKFREADAMKLSGIIAQHIKDNEPDTVFIDNGNIGVTVVQNLHRWGFRNIVGVNFGGDSALKQCKNKRAEMWWRCRDWMANGGAIPDDQELCDDLIGPEYFTDDNGIVLLERKKDMKKRGLASPDCADALACTFAFPVAPKSKSVEDMRHGGGSKRTKTDYDPLRRGKNK